MTWKELKDFIAELNDEQLQQEVLLLQDDESATYVFPSVFEEPVYNNINEGEDCGTLEELKEIHGESFDLEQYEISIPAGSVFLFVDTDEEDDDAATNDPESKDQESID